MKTHQGERQEQIRTFSVTLPLSELFEGNLSKLPAVARDPATGQPFPGNIIPKNRLSPIALGFRQFWPLPNKPGVVQNATTNLAAPDHFNQMNSKFDHQLTPNQHFSLAYTRYSEALLEWLGSPVISPFQTQGKVISSNLSLVLRGGYGIFYQAPNLEEGSPLGATAAPFVLSQRFTTKDNISFANPWGNGRGATISANGLDYNEVNPYYQNWNLQVQRSLPSSIALDIAYQGKKGTKLVRSRDINQPLDRTAGIRPYRNGSILNSRVSSEGTSKIQELPSDENRELGIEPLLRSRWELVCIPRRRRCADNVDCADRLQSWISGAR